MPEELKSISEVRQTLSALSKSARTRMNRYIITQKGKPQSVLLGYKDYQGLMFAAELFGRPDVVAGIRSGLSDLKSGRRIPADDLKKRLRSPRRATSLSSLKVEPRQRAGVSSATLRDAQTLEK
jgi:prevent-host-death family protein